MTQRMSLVSRRELLGRISERYRKLGRKEKAQILDQFVSMTGYTRKHAITLLRSTGSEAAQARAPRKRRYDDRVRQALVQLWKAANRICAKRFVPFLPELIASLEEFGHLVLPGEVRQRLLTISPATADRLLASEREGGKGGVSTTRPGTLLRHQIPVRTFADWNEVQPGFLEGDLVAHCGETTEGSFLHTLVLVDIASGWTEFTALLRRSEADVIGALGVVREQLPFPVLGLDTDNGSEFINYELLEYCRREAITFTRSRAYRKNDQAHVEEKNGSVVRRLIGYDRYEGVAAWRALSALYGTLRLYQNFFQPSMKLVSKRREGGRTRKRYDRAQTPHQRLLASSSVSDEAKDRLRRLYATLDPVKLLKELEDHQDQFWRYAYQQPEETPVVTLPVSENGRNENLMLAKSGVSKAIRQPPRRYRRTKKPRSPHTWRTRKDPFETVWPELRLRLQIDPVLTAKSLMEGLQEKYPGRFLDGQLRTLQRRVREWRRKQLYAQELASRIGLENSANDRTGAVGHPERQP